ncbi:MAG: molybdenum cofactor guanylyltransferase, partial [Candidatus Angelobacter sp.]
MPQQPVSEDLTGFVLAGGRSTRMGTDKAALPLNGRTLLEHALQIVGQVAGRVLILGSKQLYGKYGAAIEDLYPGCGPLGGIHAALLNSQTRLNLVIAVDTPFLSAELLRYMV